MHDYITSFAEAFTKLKTNPGHYDIIDLSTPFTVQATDEGLLQPVDVAKLKNFKIFPDFRNSAAHPGRQGLRRRVDLGWNLRGLRHGCLQTSADLAAGALGPNPRRQGLPARRPRGCGPFTALCIGQNPDAPTDMAAIRDKLRALKPQIKVLFETEDEWLKLVAAKECVLSIIWTTSSGDRCNKYKLPVSFVVPQEGAIVWRDALSIPANAPDLNAAYAFIDFLISPDFYAAWGTAGGAPVAANTAAVSSWPTTR